MQSEQDTARRQAVARRAAVYSAIFTAAAVGVAMLGAALVAWLLTLGGLPFGRTWLVVTLIIVLPGLVAAVWKFIRER
jgi:hypothetical protein